MRKDGDAEIWSRPLVDGAIAVGLFNRGMTAAPVRVTWADLGIIGAPPVRNLWEQKDLGSFSDSFSAPVPRHGAVLIKVGGRR
jgi:alpha-galactosidase